MKMKYVIFTVIITSQLSNCVIYRLNETEYLKMPPLYHLDDYDSCIYQTNGTYCYVDINLVSDAPSDLLQVIQEYSERSSTHFNHTQLHHGICVTKTCKHFLQQNKVADRRLSLERCLNESLWRDYKLKTKITNTISCEKLDDPIIINTGDICAAVIFICLGLLNIVGSLYDLYFVKGGTGHKLLLSFSIKRNLEKLTTHDNKDPQRERLKGLHGVRVLFITLVILTHSPLPFVISTANPYWLEKQYNNVVLYVYFNGTLIVQIFFIITACLMAYYIRAYSENNKLSWDWIPKLLLKRFLRLTPAYAMVLIFTLTWIRFLGTGPLWQVAVGAEVADCHRNGWLNLIYLNNYIDNSQCMAQTWYLAANMQLYILGLLVCILAKTPSTRNFVLISLFIIGCIIPAVHTYLQDLDAVVLLAPEKARNFFVTDPTFNHSYKRGHTNIPGFVSGLALGNILYAGLREQTKIQKYKKLGLLWYLPILLIFALLLSGVVFYLDRPKLPLYVRAIVAALARPLMALLLSTCIISMVFQYENLYRKFFEWRGWRIPAQVSYSAYLLHVAVIRVFAGMNTTLLRMGLAQCAKEAVGIIFMTFLIAYPFWLFVESPLNEAVFVILGLSKKDNKEVDSQKCDAKDKPVTEGTASESEYTGNKILSIRL